MWNLFFSAVGVWFFYVYFEILITSYIEIENRIKIEKETGPQLHIEPHLVKYLKNTPQKVKERKIEANILVQNNFIVAD